MPAFSLSLASTLPWTYWGGLGLLLLSLGLDMAFARRFAGGDGARDGATCRALVVTLGANVALAVVFGAMGIGTFPPGMAWLPAAGLAAGAAGLGLRYAAVLTLGPYFTWRVALFDGHTLVTRGPFRWLRHPGYAGGLLAGAGFALALGSWLALVVFALSYVPVMLRRIRVEEAALTARFGAAYAAYAAGTRRLLPFVY